MPPAAEKLPTAGGDVARRIGGKGGGSDKGGGGVLIAVGIAFVLAAGGASAVGSGVLGSGASASSGSSSGARAQARVNERQSQAVQARLTAQGVRVTARLTDDDANCGEHSYGDVQQFFRHTPCIALHRAQLELRDRNGDVVLLAVSWVEMADEAAAREYHRLVDSSGTGNVTELSRERGRYGSVRYTGDAYASRRDGTVVANAQAQPAARGWVGLALTSIVTNAVE